jgi:phosphoglycerate dehydrogenase-like enzyme
MHVIAFDPYVSELTISEDGVEPVSMDELLQRSDYLSLHAPHNQETHHTFSAEAFAKMPNHAVIINTARGPLIDEKALIAALDDGAIAGAGLDVLEQEPPEADNPLLHRENVLISPHVASGYHTHAAGNPATGGSGSGLGAAKSLAHELRQPDGIATSSLGTLAALPHESRA